MRPQKYPLPSVNLDTALRNHCDDLKRFFEGRFGRHWRKALTAHGGHRRGFYHCNGPANVPSSSTLKHYEAIAVKLGFRPYVGREPHPFERNSRTYWPNIVSSISSAMYAPTCTPRVLDLSREFMVHRLKEAPGSDLLSDYPINPQPLTQSGNGICSPMPAPKPEVELFRWPDNDNGSTDHAIREGGQTTPPLFAQCSPRAENSCSRPAFCSLQDDSLTASCL